MKKRNKKLFITLLAFQVATTTLYAKPQQINNNRTISLYINHEKVETKVMPPVQIDERVLVPAREVFEPLGASVMWQSEEKKVYIEYQNKLIVLTMNDPIVWIDGETVLLDVPAQSINDKIMVPIRFISEEMGFSVQWIGGDQPEVHIVAPAEPPVVEPPVVEPPVVEPPVVEPPVVEPPVVEPPVIEPEWPVIEPDANSIREDRSLVALPNPNINNPFPELKPGSDLLSGLSWIKEMYIGKANEIINDITLEPYETTTIKDAGAFADFNSNSFFINANSEITNVQTDVLSGKVIIDIANSKNGLDSTIKLNNDYVKQIRTSQFTVDTTRVVLDLKTATNVRTSLTSDRKTIMVDFMPYDLEFLAVGQDQVGDYMVLQDIVPSQIQVQEYRDKGEMILFVPGASLEDTIEWKKIKQPFIQSLEAYEVDGGVEITIKLEASIPYTYQMKEISGHTYIRFEESSVKHITYDKALGPILTIEKPKGLELEDMRMNDLYRNRQIVIDLGDDYSDYFKEGVLKIGDEYIKEVYVTTGVNTQLVINEAKIQALYVEENEDYLTLKLIPPKEKYKHIVVLDAGHGGHDGGSSANGLTEKKVNLKQTLYTYELLERDPNIKVYMTREIDEYPTLQERAILTNEIEADIFVSLHNNSASSAVQGTEVLYYPSADSKSKQMAQMMQNRIINYCGTVDRKIKPRPDLYVLRASKMPAILLEGGFLTNAHDAARLKDDAFNRLYAQAVYDGIVEIFETLSFR